MNTQIQKVLYYIEVHLDDALDILTLAKVAGYSHFHFCRIFKLHTGESLMSYTVRLRLERAVKQMQVEDFKLIEVALNAGYKTPAGFLKAFKKRFGVSPSEYRFDAKKRLKDYKGVMMNEVKLVELEEKHIVFQRELGEYEVSSKRAWEKLSGRLSKMGKNFENNPPKGTPELAMDKASYYGIVYDNPKVTPEEKVRYEAAISWSKEGIDFLKDEGFETKSIAGGRYATVLHKGTSKESYDVWYALYAWVEQQGLELRDEPPFEQYLIEPEKERFIENPDLVIHIPIEG